MQDFYSPLSTAGAKARESKTSKYFEDFVLPEEDALLDVPAAAANGRISTQELIQLEENSKALQQREREINKVVQSISDLNTIFQDLARMVSEQVTRTLFFIRPGNSPSRFIFSRARL